MVRDDVNVDKPDKVIPPTKEELAAAALKQATAMVASARQTVLYHESAVSYCDKVAKDVGALIVNAQAALADARRLYIEVQAKPHAEDVLQRDRLRVASEARTAAEEQVAVAENEARLARDAAAKMHGPLHEARTNLAKFEEELAVLAPRK